MIRPMTPSTQFPSVSKALDAVPTPATLKDGLTALGEFGRDDPVAPLRAAAFYAAILLPFLYLPLLAGGLSSSALAVFVGLLLANAAALVLGHGHGQ